MKLLKIASLISLAGLLALAAVYFFVYNKPHTNFEQAKPDFKLTASEFYSAFTDTQEQAELKYNGNVVELSGKIDFIESTNSLNIAVLAFGDGLFGPEGIRCTLLDNHVEKAEMLIGSDVQIKGFCSGFSGSDVILEHCSIVN